MSLAPASEVIYDSARRGGRWWAEMADCWRYRALISQLVRRDLVTRYKRSVLGVVWTMLHPLGMMLILTLVFANLMREHTLHSYSAYVLTGLIAWNFFSQTTGHAITTLLWGGALLQRVYMPPTSFAIAAAGANIINLGLACLPLLVVLLATGVPITSAVAFVPISVAISAMFALGMALLVSALAITYYDVAEMYQIILMGWMYLTPILYPPDIYPERYAWYLLNLNPMHHMVHLMRVPLYFGRLPTVAEFLPAALIAVVTLVVGWIVFTRRADVIAYRV